MKASGHRDGFTLLELLVSSAVLGVVMMVLLTSASTGLSLWRNSEQRIAVDREGRTAMHILSEDLAGILNSTNPFLQPQFDTTREAVTPMRFFTVKPPDYQTNPAVDVGDVCFVEYRYQNNGLSRASLDSKATFDAIQARRFTNILSFEMLATNVLQFRVWSWDTDGKPTNGAAVRVVDYFMEVVDEKGLENFRRSSGPLLGQQYFSGRAAVPAP